MRKLAKKRNVAELSVEAYGVWGGNCTGCNNCYNIPCGEPEDKAVEQYYADGRDAYNVKIN